MITTNNETFYNRMKLLRQHGMSVNAGERHGSSKIIFEDHLEVAYNYRLTDIQAAVGIQQLAKLDWIISERRKIADQYLQAFADIECIRLPKEESGYFTNWQSFSVYLKPNAPVKRNELMQMLLDEGVASRRGVMTSHRETAYKNSDSFASLPATEDACDNSIIIPLYVPMNADEVNKVIAAFRKCLGA